MGLLSPYLSLSSNWKEMPDSATVVFKEWSLKLSTSIISWGAIPLFSWPGPPVDFSGYFSIRLLVGLFSLPGGAEPLAGLFLRARRTDNDDQAAQSE